MPLEMEALEALKVFKRLSRIGWDEAGDAMRAMTDGELRLLKTAAESLLLQVGDERTRRAVTFQRSQGRAEDAA